jgi:hypothetical protein
MPADERQPTEQQKELKAQLEQMVQAFNEFHETIMRLDKQQQDVVEHIHANIDKNKIEQIHHLLQQI